MYRARIESPFGPILLCGGEGGLAGLYFLDQKDCPPLADAPAKRPDSLYPSSGQINGVLLHTLRPARRIDPGAAEDSAAGQMALFPDNASRSAVLGFEGHDGRRAYETGPLELLEGETPADVVALFTWVRTELTEYFAGTRKDFGFPLALSGTPFQMKIWQALCGVPYGEVVSYGELAAAAGLTPGHGRPVGTAVGRNPVSIVVPCHRIIGSNQTLTGYTGGLSRKVALLELEGFAFG